MSAHRFEDRSRELEWRVVANAGVHSPVARPLWVHVAAATGHGSTRAQEMCKAAGFDPDEMRGGEPLEWTWEDTDD